jgi:universal stress protein E
MERKFSGDKRAKLMKSEQKILVVAEPDKHPYEVVERAAWIAGITGHDLSMLLCNSEIGPLGVPFFLSNEAKEIGEKIQTAQTEILEELIESARKAGARASGMVLEERPIADGIISLALESKPALVVKGTQYHSVAQRSIFVDTDWQLLRRCPCPLWLVKPGMMRDHPVIIAAVDPVHSHDKPATLDRAIVEHAQHIARATHGELHLIHSYQRLTGIGETATRTFKPIELPIDELDKKMQNEHRQKLDELAHQYGIDPAHTHQLPGSAQELIPAFARSHDADLVVMGALARWGLKRAIIGSTAERALDHLPCDILIVRTAPNTNS